MESNTKKNEPGNNQEVFPVPHKEVSDKGKKALKDKQAQKNSTFKDRLNLSTK